MTLESKAESGYFDMQVFHRIIEKYFVIAAERIDKKSFTPIFVIQVEKKNEKVLNSFNDLYKEIQQLNFVPKLLPHAKDFEPFEKLPSNVMFIILEPQIYDKKLESPAISKANWKNWALFIATVVTVGVSGYLYIYMFDPIHSGVNKPLAESILYIICFIVALVGIIGAHELGHVYALKRYDLKPSMPYFIPAIPPLGTFGAFVSQKVPPKNRNQLFDIGISGPLFGFIVAIFFTIIGLLLTRAIPTDEFLIAYQNTHNTFFSPITLEETAERVSGSFNNYNLFIYLLRQILFVHPTESVYYGQLLPDQIIQIHPLAFAGWVGLLLTGINILPAGKLDGGHIARAIFGRFYWIGTIIGVIALAFIDVFMVFILMLLGGFSRHEGPLNDSIPASRGRKVAYVGVIVIIIFCLPLSPLLTLYGFL